MAKNEQPPEEKDGYSYKLWAWGYIAGALLGTLLLIEGIRTENIVPVAAGGVFAALSLICTFQRVGQRHKSQGKD